MSGFQGKQQIKAILAAALECSFYIAPEEPGLTHDELFAVGTRLGLQQGEMNDAVGEVADIFMGMRPSERLLPKRDAHLVHWQYFIFDEDPDFRDIRAFDAIYSEWRNSARANGASQVRLERSMLTERAVKSGISRLAIQTAISILVFCEVFEEKNGVLRPKSIYGDITLPSENAKTNGIRQKMSKPARRTAYPIVQDVIARRHDGRLTASEPFDAFASILSELGYGPFRLWWQQLVTELRLTDAQTHSTATTVLAAALVEGALTFIVRRARDLGQGVMGSKTFDDSPTRWRIEDLLSGASSGRENAVLDEPTRRRADQLVKSRQRIHAGRMLSDFPGGPPDLRPEEARDAKATAELVVRRVLDWLQKNQS